MLHWRRILGHLQIIILNINSVNCVTIHVYSFVMDQIEYKRIVNFLRKGDYPEEFSRQAKWNFKEKVSKYFISESDKLYKVINS